MNIKVKKAMQKKINLDRLAGWDRPIAYAMLLAGGLMNNFLQIRSVPVLCFRAFVNLIVPLGILFFSDVRRKRGEEA